MMTTFTQMQLQQQSTQPLTVLSSWTCDAEDSSSIQMSCFDHQTFWAEEDTGVRTQRIYVDSFGPMDILAGRAGKRKQNILGKGHAGTRIFDETIASNLPKYQDHSHRNDRSCLIKKVVCDLLAQGCRFVKYDGKVDRFLVLNEKQIRDKVSFAFRHLSTKQGSPFPKRRRNSPSGSSLETATGVAKKNKEPSSPRSVMMSMQEQVRPACQTLSLCDVFINEQTPRPSEGVSCDSNDDDTEFLGMINDLDVDGLSLSEEEVDTTFGVDDQTNLDQIQSFEAW